jgi:beta-lactamase regulating signal transducer with metallopeptidase domain
MYVFESISIALNVFLIWILSLKMKNVKRKIINFILWFFFVIFSLNTIGNLFAETNTEKFFSILTFIFALLILRILINKK